MSEFVASLVSDPQLLGCVLRRLGPRVLLGEGEAASGVGFFQNDDMLVRKRPASGGQLPERLLEGVESAGVLAASGFLSSPSAPRSFHEDSTLPLRARRWLFSMAGRPDELEPVRQALTTALPESLARSLKVDLGAEVLFFTFLSKLRDLGRLDDRDLDAPAAGRALAAAVGDWERAFEAAGLKCPKLAVVVSNGRVLAALRRGHPLWAQVTDGLVDCARHELGPKTREHDPALRSHRALKAVTLGTGAPGPEGALEVAEGGIVAVDARLTLLTL